MRARSIRIEFVKGESRRYRSIMHRPDGVQVALDGGSYNAIGGAAGEVPHDVAHLVVEDELDLRRGVWGVLAAGGMFRHATVVGGRRAPQATRRGRELVVGAGDRLTQAEILTRAVCDTAAAGGLPDPAALRRAVGKRWWTDVATGDAIARAHERLRAAGAQWADLAPGAALEATWRLPA